MPRNAPRPAIPAPVANVEALTQVAIAVKENIEQMNGVYEPATRSVTWQDLYDLGLIDKQRMPKQ